MGSATESTISVRLVYADSSADKSIYWDETIECTGPLSIEAFIRRSGFIQAYPTVDLSCATFGVFGKVQPPDHILQDHDRVEIYRALIFDPKTSRRRRAIHRQKARNIKKKVPINDSTQ